MPSMKSCLLRIPWRDDGFVILKFFLDITKKEQEKRFEKLLASKETAWRVSKGDLKRNKHFDEYKRLNEEMLQKTDTDFAPWNIVEAVNKEYAVVKIFHTVINRLSEAVLRAKAAREAKEKPSVKEEPVKFKSSILSSVGLVPFHGEGGVPSAAERAPEEAEFPSQRAIPQKDSGDSWL